MSGRRAKSVLEEPRASGNRTSTELLVREFDVAGMTCGSCAARVQRTLGRQDGVADAGVNFATHRATVVFDPSTVDPAHLVEAVERIGYGLSPTPDASAEATDQLQAAEEAEQRGWLMRVVVAAPLALVIVVLSYWRPHANWSRRSVAVLCVPVSSFGRALHRSPCAARGRGLGPARRIWTHSWLWGRSQPSSILRLSS